MKKENNVIHILIDFPRIMAHVHHTVQWKHLKIATGKKYQGFLPKTLRES